MAVENSSTLAEMAEARARLEFRPPFEGQYEDIVEVRGHDMEKLANAVAGVSGVLHLLSSAGVGDDLGDYPCLNSNQRGALVSAAICAASVLEDFVEWHQAQEVEARAREAAHG